MGSLQHDLTEQLIVLRAEHPEDEIINQCCQLWLDILRKRNQITLKIKHHQRLDGECDFKFSLQLMEGKPCGFKEIEVLDPKKAGLHDVIKSMHQLDRLAGGLSFAGLPLIEDAVLTSLMEYKDVTCLIARDHSNQIIGYSWGIMLRDVEVGPNEKANIYWWMELAREPDFFDAKIKVGEMLRARTFELMKAKGDCDFFGYQHVLNHKFHAGIVSDVQNDDEHLRFGGEEFPAKTTLKYDDVLALFMQAHIVRVSENNYTYPDHSKTQPAVAKAFWHATSVKNFLIGGLAFFKRQKHQISSHLMLDGPIDERLIEPVSLEQQASDKNIFRQLILSDNWLQLGRSLFGRNHVPGTVGDLQDLVQSPEYDFQAIKSRVADSGKCVTRNKIAEIFYKAIVVADSPTFVLNSLLREKEAPSDWVRLIRDGRQERRGLHANLV